MQLGFQNSTISFQVFLLIVCVILLYTGCNPSFDPIKQDDRHFSVFGYLNASADTQYVRIEKLRDDMPGDTPSDLDAKVTLTNLATNQTVTMRDSVFEYYLEGKAHNFYTTMDINPGQKYRLKVSGHESPVTSAEVTIPKAFSTPNVIVNDDYSTTVEIPDMNRLIEVKAVYYPCPKCYCDVDLGESPTCSTKQSIRRMTFSHLADTLYRGDQLIAKVDRKKDREKMASDFPENRPPIVTFYDLVIVAGSSSWPDFLSLDPEVVALPDVASNVENGVGLLGGIVSDTLELDKNSCAPCISCSPALVTCEPERIHP